MFFTTIISFQNQNYASNISASYICASASSNNANYKFQGAVGTEITISVNTVNSTGLKNLFGVNWNQSIYRNFLGQSYEKGAQSRLTITAIDYNSTSLGHKSAVYTVNKWYFSTDGFNSEPDLSNLMLTSFYSPTDLESFVKGINCGTIFCSNMSYYDSAFFLQVLPIPVDEYLNNITWDFGWNSNGNRLVHHVQAGDYGYNAIHFLDMCTETWTYDPNLGFLTGYKIQDAQNQTIYELSEKFHSKSGLDSTIFISAIMIFAIASIYLIIKRIQLRT